MSLTLLQCPACSAPVRPDKGKNNLFHCPYCGHSGYFQRDDLYEVGAPVTSGLQYAVDVVLTIDATASMRHLIETVKENALRFEEDLRQAMQAKGKNVDQLRVRVVVFRDFYADRKKALQCSEFFELPKEKAEFTKFVGRIHARGGGNLPESGLEALATAMDSEWTEAGAKRRHVIVLWTDAGTHPLEKVQDGRPRHYPAGMPADLNELTDMWEDQEGQRSRRLILFAPDDYAWDELAAHWSNTIQYPSIAGQGLSKVDYTTILDAIANSV
ncbi:MAG: vWA domain-containing protein [Bacteroidota bacterium]